MCNEICCCKPAIVYIQEAAKTARITCNIWVENSDRLVAGFREMFEEGCHKMVIISFCFVVDLANNRCAEPSVIYIFILFDMENIRFGFRENQNQKL